MTLARPATKVSTVNARPRWRTNQVATTKKAGSYKTAAMVTPMPAQIR
jgi:hypothetical protein